MMEWKQCSKAFMHFVLIVFRREEITCVCLLLHHFLPDLGDILDFSAICNVCLEENREGYHSVRRSLVELRTFVTIRGFLRVQKFSLYICSG